MVYKRLVALNAELDDGRDGFRVEKDKCERYRFIESV